MHIWTRVPYVPTPQPIVDEMIRLAKLQPGQTVFDLGAGDGRLLTTAKSVQPNLTAIGYELMPSVWMMSEVKAWLKKVKVDLRWGNSFRADLTSANVIFLYLFPEAMKKLAGKFDEQLQPGTKVISHAFQFKDRTPVETSTIHCRGRDRQMYVYEW